MRGQLVEMVLHSRLLRGNHLGDPADRPLWIYLPPGYAREDGRRLPVIYMLQGMSGQIDMWRARSGFRRTPIELFDELFSDNRTPPCLLVFVDCWTSLGGSQFLDSDGTGRYHSYFCEEVVPAVDAAFPTIADRDHRAVAGKSSGGRWSARSSAPTSSGPWPATPATRSSSTAIYRNFPRWSVSSGTTTRVRTPISGATSAVGRHCLDPGTWP
jgi:hypothetical protein